MVTVWQEYVRALRWLRDIGEVLSEARYYSSTAILVPHLERLETAAKEWVSESLRAMNEEALKNTPGGKD